MDVYMGLIFPWAGKFAPQDFMACGGQALALNQYQAMYVLLGTTYGASISNP